MSLATVADADLVARCRQGDQQAWDELVNRFSRYVYAITCGSTGSRSPTRRTSSRRSSPAPGSTSTSSATTRPLRPWIATSTRRLCVDRLRAGAREAPAAEELIELEGTSDELDGIDEALAVHEAMKQLPEHCAEILDRFFARDESYRAIGEALDIPPGTIASRISRCLRKLRGQLEGRNERFRPSDE